MKLDKRTCLVVVYTEACTARWCLEGSTANLDSGTKELKNEAAAALVEYIKALEEQIEIEERLSANKAKEFVTQLIDNIPQPMNIPQPTPTPKSKSTPTVVPEHKPSPEPAPPPPRLVPNTAPAGKQGVTYTGFEVGLEMVHCVCSKHFHNCACPVGKRIGNHVTGSSCPKAWKEGLRC